MDHAPKKRKPSTSLDQPAKKPRPPPHADAPPRAAQDSPLCRPHAAILGALAGKYDVLPASIISSTQIRKRLVHTTTHLLAPADTQKPRVVLLHARTAEVCKLITVAEKCKRLLEEQGRPAWYQYNQLFDLSPGDAERGRRKGGKGVVEETVLQVEEDEEDEEESDAFETMQSRFEKAVLPPMSERTTKSLRIFLSTVPIPELKARESVTVQTSAT